MEETQAIDKATESKALINLIANCIIIIHKQFNYYFIYSCLYIKWLIE